MPSFGTIVALAARVTEVERNSSVSPCVKATKSATCFPCRVWICRSWPVFTSTACPCPGQICRALIGVFSLNRSLTPGCSFSPAISSRRRSRCHLAPSNGDCRSAAASGPGQPGHQHVHARQTAMYHAAQSVVLERPLEHDWDPGMMEGCHGALSQLRYPRTARCKILHHVRLSVSRRCERK